MGNVVIASNIKRQSARIDPAGNIIDARTKQIIKTIEPEYVAPIVQKVIEEVKKETPISTMSEKINKMVEAKIAEKIDAIVEQRVNDALKNI